MHRIPKGLLAGWLLAAATLGAAAADKALPGQSADELLQSARDTLRQLDEDRFGPLWDNASRVLKSRVPRAAFIDTTRKARQTLGSVKQRDWQSMTRRTTTSDGSLQDLPAGTYANVEYTTLLADGKAGSEKLSFSLEDDKRWHFTGYVAFRPEAVANAAQPVPAARAQPAAETPAPARDATNANPASAGNAVVEVGDAVRAWAAAWAAKDMARYFAAYAPEAVPNGKLDRRGWEAERRKRIEGKSHIEVLVDDLIISVNGTAANARFKQTYRADAVNDTGPKVLEFQRVNNRWLIRRETAG
jgi:ketosteroid isomerase-like protein